MKTISKLCFAATALFIGATAANAASLVQNGSFENGNYVQERPGAYFDTLLPGSTSISNWTVGGIPIIGGVDWIDSTSPSANTWPSSNGSKNIDMNNNAAGTLRQSIAGLVVGTRYVLTFDYASFPNPGTGPSPLRSMLVSLGNFVSVVQSTNNPRTGWQTFMAMFNYTGGGNTLRFTSLQLLGGRGALLDNVSLSAVPVPPALILLLSGLFGVGAMGRMRRKGASAG
jgi:Protein of unknown function (DUF642)